MKVAFLTLGCKVNSYETEKMKQQFEAAGNRIVSFEEDADVYIINTCTVTNIADRKSRKMLRRAQKKNPDAIVAAVGCYVDSAKKKGVQDENVDLFLSNEEKPFLLEKVTAVYQAVREKKALQGSMADKKESAGISPKALGERHTRAYLKVQDGCNQYCTYCIIPYVRGKLTSRKTEDILTEVRALAKKGVREIVVTGIHLSSYGVDWTEKKNFTELEGKPLLELLERISKIDGIERIRLGSLEPRIITQNFAAALASLPKICPHFHLSLQSGCDSVLRRMNRRYSTQEYRNGIALLRKYFHYPACTTDIIVGFPQETQEEFETTCAFVKEMAFSQIHVFKYSRRRGTMADNMEGQITEAVKAARSDILLDMGKELQKKYQNTFIGQRETVLWEEVVSICDREYLIGYNERYIRIGTEISLIPDADKRCNTFSAVHLSGRLTDDIMLAEWS